MAGVLDDLDKPNFNEDELWAYLYYDEGLKYVSRRSVRLAVRKREIVPKRFGSANCFSKRDGLDWVDGRKVPVPNRFVGANSHRRTDSAAK